MAVLAAKTAVATKENSTDRAAGLGKLHQFALINKPLGNARNLAARSRLLQLPVFHVHIARRALSYLAGTEQGRLGVFS
jgi:hypothetical protein